MVVTHAGAHTRKLVGGDGNPGARAAHERAVGAVQLGADLGLDRPEPVPRMDTLEALARGEIDVAPGIEQNPNY